MEFSARAGNLRACSGWKRALQNPFFVYLILLSRDYKVLKYLWSAIFQRSGVAL
jgi:hypothetical protein